MKSLLLLLILPVVLCAAKRPCYVNSRILGGEYAEEGEFPGVVYLSLRVRRWNETIADWTEFDSVCAGSLISDHWVLTAAHCVIRSPNFDVISVSVHPTKGHPDSIESRTFIPHPGYPSVTDDIGLLWLPQPMSSIHPNFKTVSLPVQGQELTSNEVTLVGWGGTSTTEVQWPSRLMKREHVQLNQTLCQHIGLSATEALCHYATESTGATCPGDSGGPVFMDGLQVGVVSGVKRNRTTNIFVDKETRVSAYKDWIGEQTGLYMS